MPRIMSAFICEGPLLYVWFDDGAAKRDASRGEV